MAGWENTGRYGRWTSHTGERERETEGREGVRQGIRGEERRGRVEGEQKEGIARWIGWDWDGVGDGNGWRLSFFVC